MPPRDSNKIAVEALSEKQAKAEHGRLEAEIKAHDKSYYQKDAPTVSDAEYDALRRRYEDDRGALPGPAHAREPVAASVGSAPARGFAKVRHAVPMLSLANAFAPEEVADFVGRIRRFLKLGENDEARLHRRAEDRRPVDVAALRARRACHRRHPRRRRRGRGRHRQHQDVEGDPASAEGKKSAAMSAKSAAKST